MDLDKITKVYLGIRGKRSELKREFDEKDRALKDKLATLEGVLLKFLNDNNTSSTGTAHGTVYKSEEMKPSVTDWDAVYEFIEKENAWDMLQRRIKKEFVTTYMDENDGDLPPGVKTHREFVVRVRKG